MVGMRDVAKKAGVSLSTVSLAVNGAGCVSDDMRERVAEAMRALNYVPNELARNLYHDRTNTVGVIVPTIRHPFFATLAAGLQRELSERGLRTMLCSTADSGTGEAEYVDMLRTPSTLRITGLRSVGPSWGSTVISARASHRSAPITSRAGD